jgi:uridylate kinase
MKRKNNERLLIKLSGEFLSDSPQESYSKKALERVAQSFIGLFEEKIPFGCVIGAGNLFRGSGSGEAGFDRVVGDQIGMLGTIMNALAVKEALFEKGITAHVMAPFRSTPSVIAHDPLLARTLIEKGEIVLFAGGTGNPFFTTDSAATLRALEIGASMLVKATKVSGIFTKDPMKYKDVKKFSRLTFQEALEKGLEVMDQTAFALAKTYRLPIFVYQFGNPLSIGEALRGEDIGTYVIP